jgi:hypothetical protein
MEETMRRSEQLPSFHVSTRKNPRAARLGARGCVRVPQKGRAPDESRLCLTRASFPKKEARLRRTAQEKRPVCKRDAMNNRASSVGSSSRRAESANAPACVGLPVHQQALQPHTQHRCCGDGGGPGPGPAEAALTATRKQKSWPFLRAIHWPLVERQSQCRPHCGSLFGPQCL